MRILLAPLDGRPCNVRLPADLGAVVGADVVVPRGIDLGSVMEAADRDALLAWLRREAPSADALIVSVDLLVHGGLECARDGRGDREEMVARFERVMEVLEPHRSKTTLISVIMRGTPTASSEAMLPVWEAMGPWNALDGDPDPEAIARRAVLESRIPKDVLAGWRAARERHHAVNLRLAAEAARGGLADVLFFQDDAAPRGPHVAETEALREAAAGRARFLGGTDEACVTLVAAALVKSAPRPPRISVAYTEPEGADRIGPYEHVTFSTSLVEHAEALGVALVDRDGDAALVVHPPAAVPVDLFLDPPPRVGCPGFDIVRAWIDREVSTGAPLVAVDARFANGADIPFAREMARLPGVMLMGFSAWNTASNALGTALAHAALLAVGRLRGTVRPEASLRLRDERLIEDWLFQSSVRQELRDFCLAEGIDRFAFADRAAELDARLAKRLAETASEEFPDAPPFLARFPWARLFEAEIIITGAAPRRGRRP